MRNAGVSITSRSEEAPKADGGPDPDADPDADAGGTEEVVREAGQRPCGGRAWRGPVVVGLLRPRRG